MAGITTKTALACQQVVLVALVLLFLAQSANSAPAMSNRKRKDPLEYFLVEELSAKMPIANVAIDALYPEKYSKSIMQSLRYRFVNNDPLMYLFEINETTSILQISQTIDRDAVCERNTPCLVWLHVGVSPQQYADTIRILVEILDANDHRPQFPERSIKIQTSEDVAIGTSWPLPMAKDVDSGDNGKIRYELATDTDSFDLITTKDSANNTMDVRLKVIKALDREMEPSHILKVIAYDGGKPPRTGSIVVRVSVDDINDNNPKFNNSTYEFFIIENADAGTPVGLVHAVDKDLGPNGELVYGFSNQTKANYGHLFGVVNSSGLIYQKGPLDFETGSTYLLVVIAHDKGLNSQPSHANVIVRVEDANDNAPEITLNTAGSSGVVEIPESTEEGAAIASITVSDQDGGDNGKVECSLTHDHFTVEEVYQSRYRVVTKHDMSTELNKQHDVTIVCHDLGRKPKITMASMSIRVVDNNDHPPRFNQSLYVAHITENNNPNDEIVQVSARDYDEGAYGQVRYKLHHDAADEFKINSETGLIRANSVFDYERSREYMFHVIAFDMGSPSLSATATVRVNIKDTNDEEVQFKQNSYEFGVFENIPIRSEVGEVAVQHMGEDKVTFSVANPNNEDSGSFSINPSTGKITTTAVLDRERQPVYYLSIMATNKGYPPMTGTVSVTVYVADQNDHSPEIKFPNPSNNTVYISTHTPVGYGVAKIEARDRDLGGNGKLNFLLPYGNTDGAFNLHPSTGQVTVAKDLTKVSEVDYDLVIEVQDQGFPKRSTTTHLNIMLNGSIAFIPPGAVSEALISESHATIVIAATASTLIVVFLILFAVMMYLVWKRLGPKLKHGTGSDLSISKRCYRNVSERTLYEEGCTFERDRGVAEGQEASSPMPTVVPPTSHHHSNVPASRNNLSAVAAGPVTHYDNEHNLQLESKPSNIQTSNRQRNRKPPPVQAATRLQEEEGGSPPGSPTSPTPPPPYSTVCNLRSSPGPSYATTYRFIIGPGHNGVEIHYVNNTLV